MNPSVSHIQININFDNLSFYKKLMEFMGWTIRFEFESIVVYTNGIISVLFQPKQKDSQNDYDGIGMNHIGFWVDSVENVDKATQYLKDLDIEPLFGTPKYRPEVSGEKEDYYQIMFETPDKILFEILYWGPKD